MIWLLSYLSIKTWPHLETRYRFNPELVRSPFTERFAVAGKDSLRVLAAFMVLYGLFGALIIGAAALWKGIDYAIHESVFVAGWLLFLCFGSCADRFVDELVEQARGSHTASELLMMRVASLEKEIFGSARLVLPERR